MLHRIDQKSKFFSFVEYRELPVMAQQITDLIKNLDSNTLSSVANLANTNSADALGFVKNLFGSNNSLTAPQLPIYQPPSVPEGDLDSKIDLLYYTGLVVSILLILWNIFLVISKAFIQDKETRDNIEYSDELLFGHSGLVNNLFMLWVILLAAMYIITGIIYVNQQIPSFVGNLGKVPGVLSTIKGVLGL